MIIRKEPLSRLLYRFHRFLCSFSLALLPPPIRSGFIDILADVEISPNEGREWMCARGNFVNFMERIRG